MPYKDIERRKQVARERYANNKDIRDYQSDYRKSHVTEFREYNKKSYKRNKKVSKNSNLIRRFGITIEDYEDMFKRQKGRCAICKNQQLGKSLAVDHNHKTGKVRGLICQKCNTAIGLLNDNPNIVKRVLNYLLKRK